jgi:hypothetical protein
MGLLPRPLGRERFIFKNFFMQTNNKFTQGFFRTSAIGRPVFYDKFWRTGFGNIMPGFFRILWFNFWVVVHFFLLTVQ